MFKRIYMPIVLSALCLVSSVLAEDDPGTKALEKAKESKKFLLAMFYDNESNAELTGKVKSCVKAAASELADKIDSVLIDVKDKKQQALVNKLRLRYAPRPLVLIMAPNGSVVGSFQKTFTVTEVKEGLPGPGMLKCITQLQGGKMVMLCVCNDDSEEKDKSLEGVDAFLKDPKYAPYAAKIIIDPSDKEDQATLKRLKVDPATKKAVSMLLVPPGAVVGKWEGAVTKDQIIKQLTLAMSMGGACGSGGCVDPGCAKPQKGATK